MIRVTSKLATALVLCHSVHGCDSSGSASEPAADVVADASVGCDPQTEWVVSDFDGYSFLADSCGWNEGYVVQGLGFKEIDEEQLGALEAILGEVEGFRPGLVFGRYCDTIGFVAVYLDECAVVEAAHLAGMFLQQRELRNVVVVSTDGDGIP